MLAAQGREDIDFIERYLALGRHLFEGVGPHRPGVGPAGQYRLDHLVVGLAEPEGPEIPVGVDAVFKQFPPRHLPAAQRRFGDRHEDLAAQVDEPADIGAIAAAEDDAAVLGIDAAETHLLQRRDPVGAVQVFELDIGRRVGEDEIDLPFFHRRIDPGVLQRDNDKAMAGDPLAQVVGCRRPTLQALLLAPDGQDADLELVLGGGGAGLRPKRDQQAGQDQRGAPPLPEEADLPLSAIRHRHLPETRGE